ncbi:ATP synthase F1 subunit delta [Lyticum sinuosum]|uniref:ATP synthase subunit delta n=1 Tax=Lyticum sinuosum TaxID=1332059 RepID=A0AAE4VLY8_9RICK|nr:ATP synthase F1 subunit delta [Lyticum sinuosum]MDZ5761306.1 ATP synthase subunit delta [Lyticum sinuosum]
MQKIIDNYSKAFTCLYKDREISTTILNELDQVYQAFIRVGDSSYVFLNPESPMILLKKIVSTIKKSWENHGFFLSREAQVFISILIRNRNLNLLGAIISKVREIHNLQDGFVLFSVESAYEISEDYKNSIVKIMEKKYPNNKILTTFKINKKLISGILFRMNDKVLDLSLSSRLSKLKKEFCN